MLLDQYGEIVTASDGAQLFMNLEPSSGETPRFAPKLDSAPFFSELGVWDLGAAIL